jgi:hypothetical protein
MASQQPAVPDFKVETPDGRSLSVICSANGSATIGITISEPWQAPGTFVIARGDVVDLIVHLMLGVLPITEDDRSRPGGAGALIEAGLL